MFAIILGSFGRVFKAFHRNDFIATTPSKVKLVVTNKYMIARSAMRALAYVADSRGKVHIPPEK